MSETSVKAQVFFSVAAGKQLIAEGLASRADIQEALREHTVVVIMGTTNGYLAEELLKLTGSEGFDKRGFFRGNTRPAGRKLSAAQSETDLVIVKGEVRRDLTIYDVVNDLKKGDVIFKGVNALHYESGTAGILIGDAMSGTILPSTGVAVGRRVRLIHPAGLEKRVEKPIYELAREVNRPDVPGLRLFPTAGTLYTELEAMQDLFQVKAELISAGGIGGYEGGIWYLCEGEADGIAKLKETAKRLMTLQSFAL